MIGPLVDMYDKNKLASQTIQQALKSRKIYKTIKKARGLMSDLFKKNNRRRNQDGTFKKDVGWTP